MTDDRILELMRPALDEGDGGYISDMASNRVIAAGRAIQREALEEAAKVCDELERLALEDQKMENDERYGVYAKKYRLAARHIRATSKENAGEQQ